MFFTRKSQPVVVQETNDAAVVALAKQVRDLGIALEHERGERERLDLAFNAFRQRVYAWKRWEDSPAQTNGSPPTDAPAPLDKAAILRAHRSKQ